MRFAILLCLAITCSKCLLAQNSDNSNPPVIHAAPNTASLLKYAQMPVSKYTGIPDISIPLYTIKSGTLSLPISVSYHASGIKTSEEASWVGLGWALSCGGVIGRSVRGGDDFGGNYAGYPGSPAALDGNVPGSDLASFCTSTPSDFVTVALEAFHGSVDTQPDLFYFNMGGYSGKFYIARQNLSGDVEATQLDQKSNLKIKVVYGEKRFIITDGNGIQYYFGTKEYSYSESQSVTHVFPPTELALQGNCEDSRMISSWYLDTIAAPSGDRIYFNYTVPDQCYGVASPTSSSESHYRKINLCGFDADYYDISRSVTQEAVLTGVTFKEGHVDFYTSPRTDVNVYGSYTPQKLDSILIQSNSVVPPIRSFKFQYDYFNEDRLKLTQLYTEDKPYSFTYNETVEPPSKITLGQDHWGYYNGQDNNHSLIPKNLFGSEDIFWANGGNRDADSVLCKVDILTQITYPTGGQTRYDYELNDFQGVSPIYQISSVSMEANLTFYPTNPSVPSISKDFYLPRQTWVTMSGASFSNLRCDEAFSTPEAGEPFAILVPITDSAAVGYSSIQEYSPAEISASLTYDGCSGDSFGVTKTVSVKLNPGWYRVIDEANYEQTVSSVSASFNKIIGYNPGIAGGGLRVKRITAIDAGNNSMVTRYIYREPDNPSSSSGRLMTAPNYEASLPLICWEGDEIWGGPHNVYSSTTSSPLSTDAEGAFVGYDAVTEMHGENGENGKVVSFYKNQNWPVSTYYTPPIEDPSNGLLTSEYTYNSIGTLLKYTNNQYQENVTAEKTIKGLDYRAPPYAYSPPSNLGVVCEPDPGVAPDYVLNDYTIICSWWQLLNSTTTTYTPTGNQVAYTSYTYNNLNKQTSRGVTILSDGSSITTKYKYATDYSSSAGSIYNSMVTANMLNAPTEVQTWRERNGTDSLINSNATEYKLFANNKFISPFRQYQLNLNKPISSSVVGETSGTMGPFSNLLFNASYFDLKREFDYDNYGNPVKITSESQKNTSYQWAYNHEYPVAECKNALNTEFYYEGYEESTASGVTTGTAHTGHKYTTDAAVSWTLPNGRAYLISYWYSDGTLWHYAAPQAFTGTFTMQSASGYDDVRIYPADAQITTYTYDPLIGMTSATDAKGQTTYYEYDSLQRLINVKDQYGNVLKHTDYHYQGQ